MKMVTVQELTDWSIAEKALAAEPEVLVTKNGKPVAKLVAVSKKHFRTKPWDSDEHFSQIKKILGDRRFAASAGAISKSRGDRTNEG